MLSNYLTMLDQIINDINKDMDIKPHYTIRWLDSDTDAMYSQEFNAIHIHWTTTLSLALFIDTYLHEARHAYQWTHELDVEYKLTCTDGYDEYFNCSAETDARKYAYDNFDKYYNKYNSELKTYDLPQLQIQLINYYK